MPKRKGAPRERMTPEQQATRTVERLTTEIKVDRQTTGRPRKNGIPNRYKKREEAMQGKTGITVNAMRDTNRKKTVKLQTPKLKKVLTEEQYKTYKANEEKRMKEWQQRGRQGGGHPQR